MAEHLDPADREAADRNPLGPLDGLPLPALADPSAVRARGQQRRRRQRVLLTGAAGLAAVAVGGVAALATGGASQEQTLVPGVPTSTSPALSTSPSSAPSELPSAFPTGVPTALPTPGAPEATPSAPRPTDLLPAGTLPTASSLGPYNWVRHASQRDPSTSQPAFDPCGREQRLPDAGRLAFLSGSYRIEERDQPGVGIIEGPGLYEEVARYASAQLAADAVSALREGTAAPTCSGYVIDGSRYVFEVLDRSPLLVEQTTGEVGGPLYPFPVYSGVVRVGQLVAVFEYNPGEQVDRAGAADVARLVREGLCRTAGGC